MKAHADERTRYPARLASNLGWVRGHIELPPRRSVLDALNDHDGMLRVVNAYLSGRREHVGDLDLRVAAVSLVLPGDVTGDQRSAIAEARARIATPLPRRRVLLMLDRVSIVGTVQVRDGARVWDAMRASHSFVRVEGAAIHAERGGGQSDLVDTLPELYVNVDRIHGISEVGDKTELATTPGSSGR